MADGGDANRLAAIGQLIDDPISADSQRVQAAELPSKGVPREGVPLQQAKRVLDCVDQRPVQFEEVPPSPPGEDESGQGSGGARSTL